MSVLKKKTQVVMFTTNEKAENCLVGLGKAHLLPFKHNYYYTQSYLNEKNLSVFHLYFLSLDEKPKVGDWYVVELWNVENNTSLHLEQVKTIDDIWINNSSIDTTRHINNCKKVIAATNKSIILPEKFPSFTYLPQPSILFIAKFIKLYNQGNPIQYVNVDYELDIVTKDSLHDGNPCSEFVRNDYVLKVDKNNEITITPIKDSYSKKELQKLFDSYGDNFAAKIIWQDILNL